MTLTNLFQIDGKSLYAPDCDIEPSYSDLDSSDSGRDEAWYMLSPLPSCTAKALSSAASWIWASPKVFRSMSARLPPWVTPWS